MNNKLSIFIQSIAPLLILGCGTNKPLTSDVAQQSFPIPSIAPVQPPTVIQLPSPTPTTVAVNIIQPSVIPVFTPPPLKASLAIALPQNIPFLGVPVGASAQICVQITNIGLGQASHVSPSIGAPFTVSNSAISNCSNLNAYSFLRFFGKYAPQRGGHRRPRARRNSSVAMVLIAI